MLLRGGMLPQAYVYPERMRATRDLLRRRNPLVQRRAELLAHIQNTNSQYNLPELGKKIGRVSNREGLSERFASPCVRKSIELDTALIDTYDCELSALERYILKQAKTHDRHGLYLLRSVPGIGEILSLTILYEIENIERFEQVGNFLSSGRLVKCARESAGKKVGTGGAKIGNVHLRWAFGEAACLYLRNNPAGQKLHARLVARHGKAQALSILEQKLGRAVYFMLKRNAVFDPERFVKG